MRPDRCPCPPSASSCNFGASGPFFSAIPYPCDGTVNTLGGADTRCYRQISFCGATKRVIEFPEHYKEEYCQETTRGNPVPSVAHQPPRTARANGIDICYEIFGERDAEPMILIMGLGAQMVLWDDEFCERLAARGFRVIRFDNRDIGQSSQLTGGKRLGAFELLKLRMLKIPVAAPYKLRDMAEDTVALMDVLGIRSAHLVGASMGGMIAQEIAIIFPERVRSLTSIMSTTGNPRVPPPTREAAAMLMAPPPKTRDEYIARFAQTWKILRVGSFPEDEALDRARAERTYQRGLNPAGVGRQLRAILASGSRKERLRNVKAPTLVIHGTVDPLVHPMGGQDTAASIPGAKLLMIEGMGHAIPMPMWQQIISAIDTHAHGAAKKAA
ncbi:MAG: alpha/beta hydrolase [Bradyrhizobium sp.]|nr:alpha/beta hydrolase [Bradyrhizobium sp.]